MELKSMTMEQLLDLGDFPCECGKIHRPGVKRVIIEKNAVRALPALLNEIHAEKPLLISGESTFKAGGPGVCETLELARIPYSKVILPGNPVKPVEASVGSALMHFDYTCDAIIGIGSGVVNDIGKILARATGRKYIIVATAPSMDGFVSATSSMERDGLKVSLDSTAAYAVVGDLDILCEAPALLLRAGLGDMIAKITSLAEWKLSHLITGEYYCPRVAELVQSALDKVLSHAEGILQREPDAVSAVMEGLICAGLGMNYAGVSRPASGTEHYFSHIWDMRALAFPAADCDLHGIQAGIGTVYTLRAFEEFLKGDYDVDRRKAMNHAMCFSAEDWNARLREYIGPGAEAMIAGEQKERKYDPEKLEKRLNAIEDKRNEILAVISALPKSEEVIRLMASVGLPVCAEHIGCTPKDIQTVFQMTKDIRDKYISTRLFWDLGILDELSAKAFL